MMKRGAAQSTAEAAHHIGEQVTRGLMCVRGVDDSTDRQSGGGPDVESEVFGEMEPPSVRRWMPQILVQKSKRKEGPECLQEKEMSQCRNKSSIETRGQKS